MFIDTITRSSSEHEIQDFRSIRAATEARDSENSVILGGLGRRSVLPAAHHGTGSFPGLGSRNGC